jgi:hypothetical protein
LLKFFSAQGLFNGCSTSQGHVQFAGRLPLALLPVCNWLHLCAARFLRGDRSIGDERLRGGVVGGELDELEELEREEGIAEELEEFEDFAADSKVDTPSYRLPPLQEIVSCKTRFNPLMMFNYRCCQKQHQHSLKTKII